MSRTHSKNVGPSGGGLIQLLDAFYHRNGYLTIYIQYTMIASGFFREGTMYCLTYMNCIYNEYVHTAKNPKRFQWIYTI